MENRIKKDRLADEKPSHLRKQVESMVQNIPNLENAPQADIPGIIQEYEVDCAELDVQNRTLRKALEESWVALETLVRSERMYREMVESARSVILRWKLDGSLIYINRFGIEFLGYSPEELKEKGVGVFIPERESTGRDLSGLLADVVADPEKYRHFENENILKNGDRVYITWTNRPVYDFQGKLAEIISIGNDITERKRAEESLIHLNERLVQSTVQLAVLTKELDMFSFQVSHDLRGPLRIIEGFSRTLLEKYSDKLDAVGQNYLTRIRTSAQRMSRLVEDLLTLSRTTRAD